MSSVHNSSNIWGSSFRLVASEKWKAKSAVMGRDVTNALVEYARPTPAMQVLDLASGTGEPAISIASRVGSNGQVTALDLSDEVLEIARERAAKRGLTNLKTVKADANKLPFEDHSFDLVTCRFGVMFFRERALREACRVLRPMGRACFCAWGPFEQPYWSTTMGIVAKYAGGPVVDPRGPNPFKYAKPGTLSADLQRAGFNEIEEETVTVPWTWPGTAEEVWDQARAVAAPFRPLLERLPKAKWEAVNSEVRQAIDKYRKGDQIEFGAAIVLASGVKA